MLKGLCYNASTDVDFFPEQSNQGMTAAQRMCAHVWDGL